MGTPVSDPALSLRTQAKADRRAALLAAAAELFAERGYAGVSLEDLGAAAGVSGPAVYRHFAGKQAVLTQLLVGVSESLLAGGQAVVEEHPDAASALSALIEFHVRFALADPHIIRVQDRDLDSLEPEARHQVRSLQRRYSELWVDTVTRLRPELPRPETRLRVQATFGLINSTPHALHGAPSAQAGVVLGSIARAALLA
ncbi:TetR/AcrR family transcriptional regulator [Salinibacterium sp. SYSU T00001]|uniref:TetR/AcrR family transcriptional regulator n=1 Tax=Homoserinimonas sedimenticola TaxID=2986805 RepID=UPI002235BC87|nr:TetR/AcrR family transcriptional regulator [Salinibacterium sedimenticola]MCW4384711.1 TetR/AcrR family transcriptional regulator [Salinibacterium sedimenticola]